MINIYPMLISNSVSKTIIPGIAKVVENYILIYQMDDIIWSAKQGKIKYKVKSGKIIREMQVDPGTKGKGGPTRPVPEPTTSRTQRDIDQDIRDRQRDIRDYEKAGRDYEKGEREKAKAGREREREDREGAKWEEEKKEKERRLKSASVDIGPIDMNALSLEPTWVKVDSYIKDIKTTSLIGIKAAPFAVKSDEKFAHLLLYDKQVKGIQSAALNVGRKSVRWLWKVWDRVWASVILGGDRSTASGDPRRDILLRRSLFSTKNKANIFAIINMMDLTDDFFQEAGGINKLFKKGWTNLIVVDDVNRMAHFCMKNFRGICTSISYAIIFQRVGQYKVYESLEDVRRSSSSLFKVRSNMMKIMANAMAKQKYLKYRGR